MQLGLSKIVQTIR